VLTSLLSLAALNNPNKKDKAETIWTWLSNKPPGSRDLVLLQHKSYFLCQRSIVKKVRISGSSDFWWTWESRTASISFIVRPNEEKTTYLSTLWLDLRQYRDLASPHTRQFVQWHLVDFNCDGIVDKYSRNFAILYSLHKNDRYFYLIPKWPKGFRDLQWYKPSKEEAQRIYEGELNYWLLHRNELMALKMKGGIKWVGRKVY